MRTQVKHIMKEGPWRLNTSDLAYKAIAILSERGFRHLPVVEGRKVVGIVSVFDLIRLDLDSAQVTTVKQVMTSPAKVLRDDDPIDRVIQAFTQGGMHSMPVVDEDNTLVGILSSVDVINYLSDELTDKYNDEQVKFLTLNS